jgi:tripartite-type tricarboxylate transporter receptor subunit TctC
MPLLKIISAPTRQETGQMHQKGKHMYRKTKYLLASATMGCLITGIALAAGDDGFYKGKALRLIVAFAPGGGFDTYSRAIGRHMSKHIPGNPSIVVENMTGAGGFIHANYMYRQAKPDGLTLGNNIGGLILQQIMGAKGANFDGKEFEFIGAPSVDNPVCVLTKASGITSMDQWFAAKQPVKLGGVGAGGTASDVARAVQAALKLPIRLVEPYKGTAEVKLAAESGELDGGCWAWESMKTMWPRALETGDVKVVVMVMSKKHPELPNVPLAIDYAKTEDARRILKYAVHDIATITRIYFVPPATPKDRVEVLRKAFADTLKDPEFLADAKKSKLDIELVAGVELQKLVQNLYKMDPSMLARLKEVLLPK